MFQKNVFWAPNTSSISITSFSQNLKSLNVLSDSFFQSSAINAPLVEVIPGLLTENNLLKKS